MRSYQAGAYKEVGQVIDTVFIFKIFFDHSKGRILGWAISAGAAASWPKPLICAQADDEFVRKTRLEFPFTTSRMVWFAIKFNKPEQVRIVVF